VPKKKTDAPDVPNRQEQLLLDYFLANLGRKIDTYELFEASGRKKEYTRRVRNLRQRFGYQILTHHDRRDLKTREYLMETDVRIPAFEGTISAETRSWVLERNGYTCQMCGLGAGDPNPITPARKTRLTLGHIVDKSKGGDDTPSNLRAVCFACNQGLQNTSPPKPDRLHLMGQLRRATVDDQLHALEWLQKKFESTFAKEPAKALQKKMKKD
jgi:5-methylcytosine-specific restriction endonuclease McrA